MNDINTTHQDRRAPLEISADEIRRLGYRVVDIIADELTDPTRRGVYPPPQSPERMAQQFGGPPPEDSMDADAILDLIRDELLPASANYCHPRLMSYVSSSALALPGLVEGLVASLRLYPYTWTLTPGSTEIETTVARWLGQMLGFGDNAAGYMATGGTGANLMALAAARVAKAGWDVREDGIADHQPLIAYGSTQTHACLDQAFRLMGLGSRGLRRIAVDEEFRVRPDLLDEAIARDKADGRQPFCIIANAGTTNTGAVDDLTALADLAERHSLWFHVDGAYGAVAALSPRARPLFEGLERADSMAVDPHKWLNVPYEAGCVLVRSWDVLARAFTLVPEYLRMADGHDAHDHWHHGWELTRGDRALKVWVAIKQIGFAGLSAMVDEHLAMTQRLARMVDAADDLELMVKPSLSVCCFRYVPPDLKSDAPDNGYLDRLNEETERVIQQAGDGLITGTDLNGRRCFRPCFVNHRLTQDGIDHMIALLRQTACETDARLRDR
ncbi:MAG: pyridoxal-dependent decarboxylase [Pseudomonadota bacterium]